MIEETGQRELENPIVDGRNIKLDILARDSQGKLYVELTKEEVDRFTTKIYV